MTTHEAPVERPDTPGEGSPAGTPAAPAKVEGYCVKCKAPREMRDVEIVKTKNGRTMARGKCPVCGTTMTKFLKSA